MSRTYELTVGAPEAKQRLDHFLVYRAPKTLSRSAIQRAIEQGEVTVDGKPATSNQRLREGQHVTARFDELPQRSEGLPLVPESIPLSVVYEDDQVLVVNKPAGLVTHPAPGHWSGTLVNGILWHLGHRDTVVSSSKLEVRSSKSGRSTSNVPLPTSNLPRAGIVHRLDKDTSGLLVVAKTAPALRLLAKQLKSRTMSRRYLAVVQGHLPFDEGTVNAAIGRHQTDRKVMAVRHLGGREAVTHYRVLGRFLSSECGIRNAAGQSKIQNLKSKISADRPTDPPHPAPRTPHALKYSVIELSLETGRTHQIRVHLAHLGHPVLGDIVYGKTAAAHWQLLEVPRQLLHAYAIRFTHPGTSSPMELSCPVPDDIARWLPAKDDRLPPIKQ